MTASRSIPSFAALALAVGLYAAPTLADDTGDDRFSHRLRLHVTETEADFGPRASGEGFGLDWEMKLNPRVGIALGAWTADLDQWFDDDSVRMTPFTAAALFHMTPDRAVDFYLGPGVAWVTFSDESVPGLDIDDSVDPMFQLGIDVMPRNSRFGFNLDVKNVFGDDGDHHDWDWDWSDWDWNHDREFDGVGFHVTVAAGLVVRF